MCTTSWLVTTDVQYVMQSGTFRSHDQTHQLIFQSHSSWNQRSKIPEKSHSLFRSRWHACAGLCFLFVCGMHALACVCACACVCMLLCIRDDVYVHVCVCALWQGAIQWAATLMCWDKIAKTENCIQCLEMSDLASTQPPATKKYKPCWVTTYPSRLSSMSAWECGCALSVCSILPSTSSDGSALSVCSKLPSRTLDVSSESGAWTGGRDWRWERQTQAQVHKLR